MSEKDLYKQKFHAQLDVLKADVDKLKAKASIASANVQIELNKKMEDLDQQIRGVHTKLSELTYSSAEAWESIKKGVESAWDSLKATYNDVAAKFKN